MDIDRLAASPIGHLVPIQVPTTPSSGETAPYWAYVPSPLPAEPNISIRTSAAASRAAMAVGRLDQAVSQLPRPDLLLRPIVRREATSTSALEGTFAELDEVLESDFLDEQQMSREQREIQNVVRATDYAVDQIRSRPISRRLIGDLQTLIVRGTDGESYDAGDLRNRQVYIGPRNRPVEEARFIPCPPGDALVEGFSDWEKWINNSTDVPIVVRLALGHYQFETLHPYADGNGRLGRLVTSLQLMEDASLRSPILNLSTWLESRRDAYINHLLETTCTGDFDPWVQFFAQGVEAQAEAGVAGIAMLLEYKDNLIAALRGENIRGSALQIAENLIGYPVLNVGTAQQITAVSFQAANTSIARLQALGVLQEITRQRSNRLFVCPQVLDIINGRQSRTSRVRLAGPTLF